MKLIAGAVSLPFLISLSSAWAAEAKFELCLNEALEGPENETCAKGSEANACIGMRRALENSDKKDRCLDTRDTSRGCAAMAYKQNTQADWVSVAAGHLQKLNLCVYEKFKAKAKEDLAESHRIALQDEEFLEFLKRAQDGSARFGLKNGEIIERNLKGESFGEIVRSSPVGLRLDEEAREALAAAANIPLQLEDSASEELVTENLPPNRERKKFGKYRSNGANFESEASGNYRTEGNIALLNSKTERTPSSKDSISKPASKQSINPDIFVRTYSDSPYSLGLDLSLFDRVSKLYRKKSSTLKSWEEHAAATKNSPKDYSEYLRNLNGERISGL